MNEGAVIASSGFAAKDCTLLIVKAAAASVNSSPILIFPLTQYPAPIKYNRIVSVEFFLNLTWILLSASLVLLWLRGLRNSSVRAQHPGRKIQLLALAMLIIILFPVISMTDDMQAMSTAEIEHVATRRADLLPNSDQPADIVVPLDAEFFSARHLFNLQTFARVEPSIENSLPRYGSIRQLANRPPPLAA